jgi:hypothetical protein
MAEPTTQESLIENAAKVLHESSDYTLDGHWLARALADAGLLADPEAARFAQRDREQAIRATADRERIQAELRADQVATLNLYTRVVKALGPGFSITAPWHGLSDAVAQVVAERDGLQARIDAALEALDGGTEFGLTKPGALHAVRAALLPSLSVDHS